RPNLAPPTTFEVGKFALALLQWGEIYLRTEIAGPIKLSGRALYDDGQMVNRNVINNVTWVEFVFNKHGCRWRAEICVDRDVLEDIDSALILKEDQRKRDCGGQF